MSNIAGPNQFPNNLESSKENATPNKSQPLVFVNYYPLSEKLQKQERSEISVKSIELVYEQKIKQTIKGFLDQELQPLNIIPKKGNLDLKKFLNKRLEKLNKRTEKAIIKILRQKYNSENGIEEPTKDQEQQEQEEQEKKKKAESQNKKLVSVYDAHQSYDQEMYDEDDIIETEQIKTDGSYLIDAMATQDKIYQNLEEDNQSDSD